MTFRILGLLFLLELLSCKTSKNEEKQSAQFSSDTTITRNFKWKTYIDTVNMGFVLTFQYPDNLVAESIDNGRCVGEPLQLEVADGGITNTMRWCVWMSDTAESQPIDSVIHAEKNNFKGHVAEQHEAITFNGEKAIRVTLTSDNKNDPYRQIIYFKKYSTLFEIINNYKADKDFKTFYNSLRITEYKKPSH